MGGGTASARSRPVDLVLGLLAAGFVARRVRQAGQQLGSRRWSNGVQVPKVQADAGDGVGLVCIVPLFMEHEVVADAVQHWDRLIREASIDEVIFVTTAKEEEEEEDQSDGPSTHDLARIELDRLNPHNPQLKLLRCEQVARYRAVQMDTAVAASVERNDWGEGTASLWVGVYNADSRPTVATFDELRVLVEAEPDLRVVQQLVDYVVPARPGTSVVAVGNSVLQTWWTSANYWARNRRGRGAGFRAATTPYSTFGHGEFIRLDFLQDIGGFPDYAYADGLLLGWICRLRGEPIGLLTSRDIAEVPRNGRDLVTQQTAWMRGLLNFGETVSWCRANSHLRIGGAELAVLHAKHLIIPTAWGLSSPVLGAAVATLMARVARGGASRGDLVKLAAYLSYPAIPAVLGCNPGGQDLTVGDRVRGVLASWPLEGLAFWPALWARLRRVDEAPKKTPR